MSGLVTDPTRERQTRLWDLLRILVLWRSRTGWLLAGLALALLALGSGIALMAVSGGAIAAAVAGGVLVPPALLRRIGVARVALRYLERLVTHSAMFRALADLRIWFFRRIAATASGGLGFRHAGDLLARLVGDIEALDGLYLRVLVPLAGALLLPPVLLVVIAPRAPGLAIVVVLLLLAAALLLPWLAARQTLEAGGRLAAAFGGLRIAALDALTGLREVRAYAAEGRMLAAVQAREATLLAAQHVLTGRTALAGAAAFLCAQAALLAVLAEAMRNPTGAVVALFLVLAAFEAVAGLPRAGALMGHAAAAAHRVLAAADVPIRAPDPPPAATAAAHPRAAALAHSEPARTQPLAASPLPSGYALRFESVHFRWQADRPAVFDGLTLDVPQGARIALLGPSGAGKSTLAALALKVAAPDQGRVTLGGTDIAQLSAAAVRARIGWLGQATHLFDDTIRANLLLAEPSANDAALWAALDAARIGGTVRALPDGLDTWVGEGGARFSGGQGRRLALARALLSPAPVLILDEPAAGLDADTEQDFLRTLNETMEGRTLILITHRLTGVERLDRIFRLSGGKAVAAAG